MPKILITILTAIMLISVPVWSQADLNSSVLSLTSPYKKTVKKYTKENSHYTIGDLTISYKWYATYHSPTLLAAADKLMKKRYPEGPSPYAAHEKSEMDPERKTEFFLGLYALEPGLREVVGDKNLWEINLKVGDEVFDTLSVEKVDLNPFYYTFYPYLTKWFEGFRVVFPTNVLDSDQKEMTLIISSVRGTGRMEFPIR